MHQFLLHNGRILEANAAVLAPGQVGLLSGWGVFSTIRVSDGVLFAWERHWNRMRRDAELLHVPFPADSGPVHESLLRLIVANQAPNATLRLVVIRNRGGVWEGPGLDRDYDLVAFTTKVKDWGRNVRLALQPQGRHSGCPFAGTKMLSWSFNLIWLEQAHGRGFDEALLLNERGEVSECTSANVFAAYGCRVLTPPLSSGCLPGVTRELLLEETRVAGYEIAEENLRPEDLERADEVFITSTTRELLPVSEVEGLNVQHNDAARMALQASFSAYCDTYVHGGGAR
ncbi:MAG: aminotransferase class IV family protein [Acidobacteria bacterium]|nr:aminotransferase class IV family protein [Acidobacteriota bacterium]